MVRYKRIEPLNLFPAFQTLPQNSQVHQNSVWVQYLNLFFFETPTVMICLAEKKFHTRDFDSLRTSPCIWLWTGYDSRFPKVIQLDLSLPLRLLTRCDSQTSVGQVSWQIGEMISVFDSSNILTMSFSNISNLFQFFFRHDNWLTSQEIDIWQIYWLEGSRRFNFKVLEGSRGF